MCSARMGSNPILVDIFAHTWVREAKNFIGNQGGITCGAIDEPTKSSKAIDERVIINFRDKNVVIARFCDKNGGFIDSQSDQSIAIFFYR